MKFEIPYYQDYISEKLAAFLLAQAKPVKGVNGLLEVGTGGGLESTEALKFLCDLYQILEPQLKALLHQRIADRKFIDERVKACFEFNKNLEIDFLDPKYKTILGLEDANGRIVIGPKSKDYCNSRNSAAIAPIPEFLKGPHVTLFGPPGSAKMAINAMNTYYRKLKDEPPVVEKLLSTQTSVPKWGADDEDSKTPLRSDLVSSAVNLSDCFAGDLSYVDENNGKTYKLAEKNLSVPIKRFPGLALPCTFLFFKNNPIPLHLYDFALHLFKNWSKPEALVFYVPKLENEEEARYIHKMVSTSEAMIKKLHPEYHLGSVRLMIVLENPRAILRTHEIMDELHPYFVGASLGWHDYLGSTARLFKEDGNYRIPVKADPNIVIKYIQASHNLLSDVVGSRGGIKVGGMYGILPLDTDLFSESFQVTIKGYIKDVVTQMKRNLTGFWVAHPDFVRLGLALVEAWKFHANGDSKMLNELVTSLLDKKHHEEILNFITNADIKALDKNDPQYVRSLIVADIKESDFIANNHPDEIRYNVFQSLQYLTDWLCGNGCVALPAIVNGVSVRVMDDLATAERSRWEVWHEIRHGRFTIEDFLKIAFEEFHFIRKDRSHPKKIVQVKWNAETEKWYPLALRLMIKMMTDKNPVEFATELLMPFTVEDVRNATDPLTKINEIDSNIMMLDPFIERFMYYFEVCGNAKFANEMAKGLALDTGHVCELILNFSKEDVIEAAAFHGNIGEGKKTLDAFAAAEQALVFKDDEKIRMQLTELGKSYLQKYEMKFLISAKARTGAQLLASLQERLHNTHEQELHNAREALLEISLKRFREKPFNQLMEKIEALMKKHKIDSSSIAINVNGHSQALSFGPANKGAWFELASLSKTLASAFSIEYFARKNISLDASVDKVLQTTGSEFRLHDDRVTIRQLMNHTALNMHYVKGFPNGEIPDKEQLLSEIKVQATPGEKFNYSGGGFIVLEHLIEALEQNNIQEITDHFFTELSFTQTDIPGTQYATGFFNDGTPVPGTRLLFPAFAAGAMGTAQGMAAFLNDLTTAYHSLDAYTISHDTAVQMLHGFDKGCRDFMGCDIGLGVFTAECGDNKMAIHQGANEGFRCIYIHCFAGPDKGNGLVILCNADSKGVFFNAEAAQEILKELNITGIDYEKFKADFDSKDVSAEQLVNKGYKELVFSAFQPTLPEEIITKGKLDPLSKYNLLKTARIVKCSNQKFARATNMLSAFEPVFDPELFGKQGKIMDSWESARHNPYAFDEMTLELNTPANIRYVSLSTKFHDGNQAESVRIVAFQNGTETETEILPKTKMLGHAYLKINSLFTGTCSKVRVEMYPDGGLTRVGLYAELPVSEEDNFNMKESVRFSDEIPKTKKPLSLKYVPENTDVLRNLQLENVNLAGLAFGASLVSASNEHYGPAIQVISPFPAIHMFDGLESARSRKPAHFEEVVIKLAEENPISKVILDFEYFVNNNPRAVSIEALSGDEWHELVPVTDVKAYAGNKKEFKITSAKNFASLRLKTYPDGGINRIYVY